MNNNPSQIIHHFGLQQHPEGGYFKEVYRCPEEITDMELTQKYSGKRNLATSIYFLLEGNQVSKLHQLKSDEIWYFHCGSPVLVHIFYKKSYRQLTLGANVAIGEEPQIILPAGAVFGAEPARKDSFSFMSCMVTPGFNFDDFALIGPENLIAEFPHHTQIINYLT